MFWSPRNSGQKGNAGVDDFGVIRVLSRFSMSGSTEIQAAEFSQIPSPRLKKQGRC